MLCLSNACSGYTHPSIVDIKIGFETTYPWASEEYNAKNRCALYDRDTSWTTEAHDNAINM